MIKGILLSFCWILAFGVTSAQTITARSPVFSVDIAPIVFTKCSPCHRPNAIGPMPFTTYREVAAYGKMIAYVCEQKYMPPWSADPDYRHFSDEKKLSTNEIQLIKDWVAAGLPKGSKEVNYAPSNLTQIAKPDLQIGMREPFEQYGIYYDQFQTFVLPTQLEEDKEVVAVEFVPGNPEIVRHCRVAIDRGEKAEQEDAWDPRYGYFSYGGWGFVPAYSEWFTWSAGEAPLYLPKGVAKTLPAGSKLIVQMHYGPTGVKQRDSSYFNFKFASKKIAQTFQTVPLLNRYTLKNAPFHIPASTVKRFFSSVRLPFAIDLYDITPHSLLLAKKWEIYAQIPNKRLPIKLLKINDWDYKWKRKYRFDTPIHLPEGTLIHALVEYDNTADNPYNPVSPPIDISWGKRVYQEMLLVHFGFLSYYSEKAGSLEDFSIIDLSPNQTKPNIHVQLQIRERGKFTIELIDSESQVRNSIPVQYFKTGTHVVELPLQSLPHGVYAIRLRQETTKQCNQKLFVYFSPEDIL